jgi:hypothetical protein
VLSCCDGRCTIAAHVQGEEAVKNLNVFHHLTYEGSVNIDEIADPIQRAATMSIIDNFGQTPKQLFKKPHPQRKIVALPNQLQWLARSNNLARLITTPMPVKEVPGPVGQV